MFRLPHSKCPRACCANVAMGTRLAKRKAYLLLDGRTENDVFETHYKANTEKEVIALARATGFEVGNVEMITTDAVFSCVPPLAFFELLWIRALMTESFRSLRTTMIVVLRKVA